MPVLAVNLSEQIAREIGELVSREVYESPAQFLEFAAFNQLALEKGAAAGDLPTKGKGQKASATEKPVRATNSSADVNNPRSPAVSPRREGSNGSTARAALGAPPAKKGSAASAEMEATAAAARSRLGAAQVVDDLPSTRQAERQPEGERVWAQFNRIFNLKFACRWLAVEHAGQRDWKSLSTVADAISSDAALLGSALDRADMKAGRKRDELLATGLPRVGNIPSRDRFVAQTLARTTRAGRTYPGAISLYAFAIVDGERVALTDRGLAFARMNNPLLDDSDLRGATATLSADERLFLVRHVLEYVPGETADFFAVLKAINDGRTTPDELTAGVRETLPADWSDLVVRTHVAGVVARLAELGLLLRRWEGRYVKYEGSGLSSTVLSQGGHS